MISSRRYYVYALIDPTNDSTPFYIGKGMNNRLQSHFKEANAYNVHCNEINVIGCDTYSVMSHAKETSDSFSVSNEKIKRINNLVSQGFDHTDIARIVARYLNESTALAIESCLIKHVYGIQNLTNTVEGCHSERFRPYRNWDYLDGFDLPYTKENFLSNKTKHKFGQFYVYALRDPETNEVFYIGKGTGNRLRQHFEAALSPKSPNDVLRLKRIEALLKRGYYPHDIGRMLARVDDESQAFALEALFIKFVFGFSTLANIQPGNHTEYFRSRNDWEKRLGFDLPFIIDPGKRSDRLEKLNLMIGDGLDLPLMEISKAFPEHKFDPPKVLDASELGIEADVGNTKTQDGARIKNFIRRKKIQIELRWRKKHQREWLIKHFTMLGAYPLRRADDIFFPDKWLGSENMTDDIQESIKRVRLMLEIVAAPNREKLSPEALSLL
ncbi:MAG: GIY-YIG nuclease family protein [Desulfitobacterium sp.]